MMKEKNTNGSGVCGSNILRWGFQSDENAWEAKDDIYPYSFDGPWGHDDGLIATAITSSKAKYQGEKHEKHGKSKRKRKRRRRINLGPLEASNDGDILHALPPNRGVEGSPPSSTAKVEPIDRGELLIYANNETHYRGIKENEMKIEGRTLDGTKAKSMGKLPFHERSTDLRSSPMRALGRKRKLERNDALHQRTMSLLKQGNVKEKESFPSWSPAKAKNHKDLKPIRRSIQKKIQTGDPLRYPAMNRQTQEKTLAPLWGDVSFQKEADGNYRIVSVEPKTKIQLPPKRRNQNETLSQSPSKMNLDLTRTRTKAIQKITSIQHEIARVNIMKMIKSEIPNAEAFCASERFPHINAMLTRIQASMANGDDDSLPRDDDDDDDINGMDYTMPGDVPSHGNSPSFSPTFMTYAGQEEQETPRTMDKDLFNESMSKEGITEWGNTIRDADIAALDDDPAFCALRSELQSRASSTDFHGLREELRSRASRNSLIKDIYDTDPTHLKNLENRLARQHLRSREQSSSPKSMFASLPPSREDSKTFRSIRMSSPPFSPSSPQLQEEPMDIMGDQHNETDDDHSTGKNEIIEENEYEVLHQCGEDDARVEAVLPDQHNVNFHQLAQQLSKGHETFPTRLAPRATFRDFRDGRRDRAHFYERNRQVRLEKRRRRLQEFDRTTSHREDSSILRTRELPQSSRKRLRSSTSKDRSLPSSTSLPSLHGQPVAVNEFPKRSPTPSGADRGDGSTYPTTRHVVTHVIDLQCGVFLNKGDEKSKKNRLPYSSSIHIPRPGKDHSRRHVNPTDMGGWNTSAIDDIDRHDDDDLLTGYHGSSQPLLGDLQAVEGSGCSIVVQDRTPQHRLSSQSVLNAKARSRMTRMNALRDVHEVASSSLPFPAAAPTRVS